MAPDGGSPGAMMPVVTMWQTYCSGMEEIAPRVAERLGVPLYQQAFSSEEILAAMDQGGPDSAIWFLVGAIGHAPRAFDRFLPGVRKEQQAMAERVTAEVRADAVGGGVLMGRAATVILREHPAALHVKFDAPRHVRLARAAVRYGISHREAEERLEWEDEVRSQITIDLFKWNPIDNDYFDLVLNTWQLDPDTCADIVVAAAAVVLERARAQLAAPS